MRSARRGHRMGAIMWVYRRGGDLALSWHRMLLRRSVTGYSVADAKPDCALALGRADPQSPRSRANTRTLLAGMVMRPEYGRPFREGPSASIPPWLPWTAGLGK